MHLENVNTQARDAQLSGRFWTDALGLSVLSQAPELFEGRLAVGEMWLDVCIEQVDSPSVQQSPRLHLDLHDGGDQSATVDRLIAAGASRIDLGQGDVAWVVLADHEGNAFCVRDHRERLTTTGPLASLSLASADPERDGSFWGLTHRRSSTSVTI